MKVFVFVCFAINVVVCAVSDKDCFEHYFPENYERVVHAGKAVRCSVLIENYAIQFKSDITTRLAPSDDKNCILRVFDDYNITELYLRGLERHVLNDRKNPDAYKSDVEESSDSLIMSAKVLCTADDKYGDDFNEYFNASLVQKANSEESHSENCVTKYLIDSNVIDSTEYNINVSSLNLTDCEEAIKDLQETFTVEDDEDEQANTFFGLSAVKAQKCTSQKFTEQKVLQNLYSFQIILNFNLSQSQVDRLRAKYIRWMSSSVRFLLECLKEI